MSDANAVRDDRDRQRYELSVDGRLAIAAYELDGDTITFTHTEVPEASRGEGVATRLIAAALDDVRARGLRVVPACAAVADYLRRHPERQDLLTGEGRAMLSQRA